MPIKMILVGKDTNKESKNKWIKKQLKCLPEGSSIIDVGAGQLFWKKYCRHLKYTSQDFCRYDPNGDVRLNNRLWKYPHIDIVSDICNIPAEDNQYDALLCTEVLEHVPDPNLAVKELVRIVKPGGTLLLTAPFCSITHMAPYHFCSGFHYYWWKRCLEESGAKVVSAVRNGDYFQFFRQELLRLPSVKKEYIGGSAVWLKIKCALFAFGIKKYIKIDNGSGELLCFGYLVKARKIDR